VYSSGIDEIFKLDVTLDHPPVPGGVNGFPFESAKLILSFLFNFTTTYK
jgi:hypothetical protein